MYRSIMDLNEELQEAAGDACVEPAIFKATDGGYDVFQAHDPLVWKAWRADEACPQANVQDDEVAAALGVSFCEWNGQ
jgi:hypothetical protein